MIKKFLEATFADPDVFDDLFYDEERNALARLVMARETNRLNRAARDHARKLRTEAKTCASCAGPLPELENERRPALYCGAECAPPRPPACLPAFAVGADNDSNTPPF
ncbi:MULTISPECIES: hypothetical protein [unclassified Streptomyces]|uniref:hypothetical protein n=1 Tax=unclassified Streptomyces TaxID=2593676 RepID=UPI0011B941B6|nr:MULTISPECIES: hypothetical protein [unclassified Streptomyces]MYT71830.1 hypothetical protein [Streptomyces sp. SID8367]